MLLRARVDTGRLREGGHDNMITAPSAEERSFISGRAIAPCCHIIFRFCA